MSEALVDQLIDPGSVDAPAAINPKDRHVIATALAGEASIVVSNDKRLRVETKSADLGLLAMSADDFAAHLWTLAPDDVDEVINTLVAKRTKQPVTAHDLIEAMRGSFPTMTAAWIVGHT